MFHWICPECGREIAPTAKECPACDPSAESEAAAAAAVDAITPAELAKPAPVEPSAAEPANPARVAPQIQPEPLLLAAPTAPAALLAPVPEPVMQPSPSEAAAEAAAEPKIEPAVDQAPEAIPALQPRIPNVPQPASAVSIPLALQGREVSPAPSQAARPNTPVRTQKVPALELGRGSSVPHAPLREPRPKAPGAKLEKVPSLTAEPMKIEGRTNLPGVSEARIPEPPPAPPAEYRSVLSNIRPAPGSRKLATGSPVPQISLPGPTLAHELTSLEAAGIAHVLVGPVHRQAPPRRSSLMLSIAVASGLLASAMGAVFYAMPGVARSSAASAKPEAKAEPVPVPEPKAATKQKAPSNLEVTGIRFVTDVAGRGPQIHYLVVNHTNAIINGPIVNVTLRTASDQPALSQFSFRAPRLGPYESKEMISSIERVNRPLSLPDWQDVKAEIQVVQ